MKATWLATGTILVLIACGLLIEYWDSGYTLFEAWIMWAILGTLYGIGAMLVLGAFLMPSPTKKLKAEQQAAAHHQGPQALRPAPPVPAPTPVPAPAGGDLTSQLQTLANLHAQGVLNDEEYTAAKKKLLG